MPRLIAPSPDFHSSFLQALEEYRSIGESEELASSSLARRATFKAYVKFLRDCEFQQPPQAGLVYWWVEDKTFIGRFLVRHHPEDPLRESEGSMGYSIRPSFRRQGQGKALLKAGLQETLKRNVEPTLAILEDNHASLRLARSAGFLLVRQEGKVQHFSPSPELLRVLAP